MLLQYLNVIGDVCPIILETFTLQMCDWFIHYVWNWYNLWWVPAKLQTWQVCLFNLLPTLRNVFLFYIYSSSMHLHPVWFVIFTFCSLKSRNGVNSTLSNSVQILWVPSVSTYSRNEWWFLVLININSAGQKENCWNLLPPFFLGL